MRPWDPWKDRGMNLILASSSPRRREILDQLDISYQVRPPEGVDESTINGTAYAACQGRARLKAEWVLSQCDAEEHAVVVGCDTVVAIVSGARERVLGKPADEAEARQMLSVLSGTSHRVASAVAVARPDTPTETAVEISHVTFKKLTDEDIDAYVQSGDPLDKAGAYGIQTMGHDLVASIRGCYLNIVGLPVMLMCGMLGVETTYRCPCQGHQLQTCASGCAPGGC